MKFGILSAYASDVAIIQDACKQHQVEHVVIDLFKDGWHQLCADEEIAGFLVRPPCCFQEKKTAFDERTWFIEHVLKKPIYPRFQDIYIYESKRNMQMFLEYYGFEHAKTHTFFSKSEAIAFIEQTEYPIVYKSNIGAGASGIRIIRNKRAARRMVKSAFGIHRELALGAIVWGKSKGIPFPRVGRAQKHFVILQEFRKILWEWRMVKIGDSYFGHKKLIGRDGFASGSYLKAWDLPPVLLLEKTRKICEVAGFHSMSIDFFETQGGSFLVNELQAIFGQSTPHLMLDGDRPCRFLWNGNEFLLEHGDFNGNQSWDLRVAEFCRQLSS